MCDTTGRLEREKNNDGMKKLWKERELYQDRNGYVSKKVGKDICKIYMRNDGKISGL